MHDQIDVSMGDRLQDVQEQQEARLDTETPVVAVAIDPLALDVLEDEVRLTQ